MRSLQVSQLPLLRSGYTSSSSTVFSGPVETIYCSQLSLFALLGGMSLGVSQMVGYTSPCQMYSVNGRRIAPRPFISF